MIAVMVVVALLLPVDAFAETERDPPSAETAIVGALANVKSRYRAKLDHYGLSESYFDETSGICDLMQDRLLIQKYELVLWKGKKKTKDGVESIEKGKRPPRSACRKKPKPPPMHKEPELTPEEKADIEDAFKNAREANEAYERIARSSR